MRHPNYSIAKALGRKNETKRERRALKQCTLQQTKSTNLFWVVWSQQYLLRN